MVSAPPNKAGSGEVPDRFYLKGLGEKKETIVYNEEVLIIFHMDLIELMRQSVIYPT